MAESYEQTELPLPYEETDGEEFSPVATSEEVTNRTVLSDTDYNGVVINDIDGIIITSLLNKLKLNAQQGIEITKLSDGSLVFSIDATTGDGVFSGTVKVNAANKWGNTAAIQLQNGDITGLNGAYMKDVADNEGEGVLFLKTGKVAGDYSDAINDYWTLRVDGGGTLLLDGKPVYYSGQNNFLWDGYAYPVDGSTLTPTKTLTQCPNGWILVWSDFDAPSTPQNYNWYTSVIPKFVGDNGNNWSFAIPTGTSTSSYADLAAKSLIIYNDRIVGDSSASGNSTGISADIVLRYVIAY
jgi:hypothetical protein